MCAVVRLLIVTVAVLVYVTLSHVIVINRPKFSCSETKASKLVTITKHCGRYLTNTRIIRCTMNYLSQNGVMWNKSALMYVKNAFVYKNFSEDCVALYKWSGNVADARYSFTLKFEVVKYVGVMKKWDCIPRIGRCSIEVKLRADVLALPPLSYTLDEPWFWNFSSPLLSDKLDWLQSMEASADVVKHYPYTLPGLAGSGLRRLWLSGSFGFDSSGPLPRLDHLPLLATLSVENTDMVDLKAEYLAGTELITTLTITTNKMPTIPSGISVLKHLSYIKFITKQEDFKIIPEIFSGLQSLIYIDLGENHIEHWNVILPRLNILRSLILKECRMKTFNGTSLDFPKLEFLDLSQNHLTSLASNAFLGLPNLQSIDLHENFLFHLPHDLFTRLRHLSKVNLNSNNLNVWPHFPRQHYYTIKLSNNKLEVLKNLGNELIFVELLDISHNKISHWNEKDVFQLPSKLMENQDLPNTRSWAYTLLLMNNNIAVFSEVMLDSLTYLKVIDIGGNNIDCGDCGTYILQRWLGTVTTKVKNEGKSNLLTCNQPELFKGHQVQDIDFNDICNDSAIQLWLGLGLFVLALLIFLCITGFVFFFYRVEFAYLMHLAKIRSNSRSKDEDKSSNLYDAFVCYSSINRKWTMRRLVPLLECKPECYRLCLFDRDFRLGSHIVANIVDAIDQSNKVIVILTQHFIESKWCQWELEMANNKLFVEDREFLVLLELEPLERRRLPRLLRFLLATRPVVRWPQPETKPRVLQAIAQLRKALGPSILQRQKTEFRSPSSDDVEVPLQGRSVPTQIEEHSTRNLQVVEETNEL